MPAVDLTHKDRDYEDSETAEFGTVPDGIYKTEIAAVEFGWSKSKEPKLQCSWRHKIIEGEHRGANVFKNYSLESKNLKWLKGDVKKCGLAFKNLSDMQNRKDKLIGLQCEIAVKQDGEWSRVYLRSVLTDVARQDYNTPPPEDDAPF